MPNVERSVSDLLSRLSGIVHVHRGAIEIVDVARLRADGIRDLAWTAAFGQDPGDRRDGAMDRLGGRAGARRAVGQHP